MVAGDKTLTCTFPVLKSFLTVRKYLLAWALLKIITTPMPNSAKSSHQKPSSNWQALQKKLPSAESSNAPRKRRKVEHTNVSPAESTVVGQTFVETSFIREQQSKGAAPLADEVRNGESLSALRSMISGELNYSPHQQQPGKYLALDCEMVGVGPEGKESSLARASLVNYHGAIQLDVFVRQRERVVDYRTEFSGVRPKDMIDARPFAEVQKQIAELLKDRILVGHAVHNDLKALLLSHPRHLTRDTQIYAHKHKVVRTRRAALRHLVQQELGVAIQSGEHSSVTDARATMALYRLHRKEWEKGQQPEGAASASSKKKRKRSEEAEERVHSSEVTDKRVIEAFPGGGRKGVSSGLSTVVKRRGGEAKKDKWWATLGSGPSKN